MEVNVSRFVQFYISWCGDEERACDEALHSGLVKNCKHLAVRAGFLKWVFWAALNTLSWTPKV